MPHTVSETTWARLAAIDPTHDCRLTRADIHPGKASPQRVWFVEVWDRRDHTHIVKSHAPGLGDALIDALDWLDRLAGS